MNRTKNSIIFWIIFLVVVAAIIVFMIVPQYGSLSKELSATQARNFASNLTSSSATNYTQRKSNSSHGIPIKNCKDVITIGNINLPAGYQIADQEVEPDKVTLCTLNGPGISPMQFSIIGIN